jgi:hypothetical protein
MTLEQLEEHTTPAKQLGPESCKIVDMHDEPLVHIFEDSMSLEGFQGMDDSTKALLETIISSALVGLMGIDAIVSNGKLVYRIELPRAK